MSTFYIILGSRGSGRREVLLDLLNSGLNPQEDRAVVLLPQSEAAAVEDDALRSLNHVQVVEWAPDAVVLEVPEIPGAATHVFTLFDGCIDPVDQIERLRDWLEEQDGHELGRIITVLDCRLLHDHPGLNLWFDACVHFSDVVLLNRREDVSNKWIGDYQQRFKKECYPVFFDLVKKGRVHNPAEILYPEPRRMSQAFDFLEEDDIAEDFPGVEFVQEIGDEDEVTDEVLLDDEVEEGEAEPSEPYFERNMAGRRVKQLPDIRPFVDG